MARARLGEKEPVGKKEKKKKSHRAINDKRCSSKVSVTGNVKVKHDLTR